ncbi:hypothetical protein HCFMJIKG_00379 [Streptococcus equi subsp. zooepidemicus]|nr:hypothetical protein HCFMJIKG_00379 [Streptococcus equi subsp. zooepidemicus]
MVLVFVMSLCEAVVSVVLSGLTSGAIKKVISLHFYNNNLRINLTLD